MQCAIVKMSWCVSSGFEESIILRTDLEEEIGSHISYEWTECGPFPAGFGEYCITSTITTFSIERGIIKYDNNDTA